MRNCTQKTWAKRDSQLLFTDTSQSLKTASPTRTWTGSFKVNDVLDLLIFMPPLIDWPEALYFRVVRPSVDMRASVSGRENEFTDRLADDL